MRARTVVVVTGLLLLGSALTAHGCADVEGCMGGDDGRCLPPTPCPGVRFVCEDRSLEVRRIRDDSERPPGLDAIAARGDILLGNSRMAAVIDAVDAPHYLAPTGGVLIDLVPRHNGVMSSGDELNQMLASVGILPDDAAAYERLEIIDRAPEMVAVIARGHLDGRPDVDIVTRYEVRPCEPGVRVRTEVYHGGRDEQTFYLADVFYWGDREVTPFVPLRGQGFVYPDLDLLELDASIFDVPFMAAPGHARGAAAYAALRCDAPTAEAFQSTVVSAFGHPRAVVAPGDALSFERFVTVADGPGASGAINNARRVRKQLFGGDIVTVRGRVTDADGEAIGGDERKVSLEFYEPAEGVNPDARDRRRPLSAAVPGEDGAFAVVLPALRNYRVRAHVLGRPLPRSRAFSVLGNDVTIDDVVVPRAGVLSVSVRDENGALVFADVVLTPAEPTQARDVRGSVHGQFEEDHCAPYLGPPHGASPACNRVLVGASGDASFAVPAGDYFVYASRGPFATLAREAVTIVDGAEVSVSLSVALLDGLMPPGALSADFHVHAGASFDSSLPEVDRALSFVASGVDVLAATDHDVVTTYADAVAALGIEDRVVVMPGVETTGQILFHEPPGSEIPQVIGHYNFWPLHHDRSQPRNGAPDDELLEPGGLFDRIAPLFDGDGVIQLNHPYAESVFGRRRRIPVGDRLRPGGRDSQSAEQHGAGPARKTPRRRSAQHRSPCARGDERQLHEELRQLSSRLVQLFEPGLPQGRDRQQRLAHPRHRGARLPAHARAHRSDRRRVRSRSLQRRRARRPNDRQQRAGDRRVRRRRRRLVPRAHRWRRSSQQPARCCTSRCELPRGSPSKRRASSCKADRCGAGRLT